MSEEDYIKKIIELETKIKKLEEEIKFLKEERYTRFKNQNYF